MDHLLGTRPHSGSLGRHDDWTGSRRQQGKFRRLAISSRLADAGSFEIADWMMPAGDVDG
jgi:hypothetical protein